MKAEIITIGDEILIGQIVDTNSAWLGSMLTKAGIEVYRGTTVQDNKEAIVTALNNVADDVKFVIMTGGLGPTKDDITKATLASYFNTNLVHDPAVLDNVIRLFEPRGIPVLEVNKKQAEVFENCEVLQNKFGTAPGMWTEYNNRVYINLPGVPYEMKGLMTDEVLPRIIDRYQLPYIYHKTVLTQGMGESELALTISEWEDKLRTSGLRLAYLPSAGRVRLRVSGAGSNEASLHSQVNDAIRELEEVIPHLIYGYEEDKLEEIVGKLLEEKNKSLSTAESCTGGYIAHLITSISGSSAYFKGSVVSYANEVKIEQLGVSASNIEKYGAVSEPVVKQMAEGVRARLKTDFAIATSGIAGPTGGTEEKPVGTVWIAVATPTKTLTKLFHFGDNRERNIKRTATYALNMLRKEIISI